MAMHEKMQDKVWKKGESGNPKGKRKGTRHKKTILAEMMKFKVKPGDRLYDFVKKQMPEIERMFPENKPATLEKLMYMRAALHAITAKDPIPAMKAIHDRLYGRPQQSIQHDGINDSVNVMVAIHNPYDPEQKDETIDITPENGRVAAGKNGRKKKS